MFGIQEGRTYDWGTITGPLSVWLLIGIGVAVLAGFVVWQGVNRREPLVPLLLFRDRNFSLANIAITVVGFSITAMAIPLMLYTQTVRGWSPTESALLLAPVAISSGVLAPVVGRLVDRVHPRLVAGFGMLLLPGLAGLALAADGPRHPGLAAAAPAHTARGLHARSCGRR